MGTPVMKERTCSCGAKHVSTYATCKRCRLMKYGGKRTCTRCGEEKPLGEFPRSDNTSAWCRACNAEVAAKWRREHPVESKARERERSTARRQTPEHKAYMRAYRLLTKYGLTVEAVDALWESQHGLCAVCSEPLDGQMNVDHDHETNRVRGLLCGPCNRMLGQAKDRVEVLLAGAAYLVLQQGVLTDDLGG